MESRGLWLLTRCLVGVVFLHLHHVTNTRALSIDAAFSYDPPEMADTFLYLISGERVILLRNRSFYMHYHRRYLDIPVHMRLQASAIMSDDVKSLLYYGDKYGYLKTYGGAHPLKRKLFYGVKRRFFRHGGPDAIAKRDAVTFLFKGCKMIERHDWFKWMKPRSVSAIGLPCPVDAAWTDGSDMVLLKGDQIWRWTRNGTVTGPRPFHCSYDLKWWTLSSERDEKATEASVIDLTTTTTTTTATTATTISST